MEHQVCLNFSPAVDRPKSGAGIGGVQPAGGKQPQFGVLVGSCDWEEYQLVKPWSPGDDRCGPDGHVPW